MIANSGGIVAELAHQFEFQFPSVKVEIRRALEDVPGIEEQGIGVFPANTLHQGGPSGHASHIGKLRMGFWKWIDMAVYIIGMEDRNVLVATIGAGSQSASPKAPHGRGRSRSRYEVPSFHHCPN